MLAYNVPLINNVAFMLCMIYPESNQGDQGIKPFSLQSAILILRSSEIIFSSVLLDFQLLYTGVRTEVIVVFYPLSFSCV